VTHDFWDKLAKEDPLWAILSDPSKRGRRWDLQEFMKTGEREIALLFHRCAELDLPIARDRALDFGCGVGRLTQALGRRFEHVVGVDISQPMLDLAVTLNRYPGVRYVRSGDQPLRDLLQQRFDLIYSNVVLQHVPKSIAAGYVGDLVDMVAPHGLLVFQLPSHRIEASDAPFRPMPDGAYGASIRLLDRLGEVVAGRRLVLAVTVTNESEHVWRQPDVGSIRVGNHWFEETGDRMVVQDDGRTTLPQVVRRHEPAELTLEMTAPASPGRYVLEIDAVHEGISWFRDKGSAPLRVPIDVRADDGAVEQRTIEIVEYPIPLYDSLADLGVDGAAAGAGPNDPGEVEFPMDGIERDVVVSLIRARGGRVVHVDDDPRTGPEWCSYRYFVTRSSD
jgi:SAM-dependent methyltransferase